MSTQAPDEVARGLLLPVIETISALIDLDPAPDSPEGVLLASLTDAVEAYELVYFPME